VFSVEFSVLILGFHDLEVGDKRRLSNHHIILDSPGQLKIGRAPLILLQILLFKSGHSRAVKVLGTLRLLVGLDGHGNIPMVEWVVPFPFL